MDILHPCCAGLDVHTDNLGAWIRRWAANGRLQTEGRTFATTTAGLLARLDWLWAERVTSVALEATGVSWKPVFNLREGHVEVMLVNAAHVKQGPGRKTDVSAAAWRAQLLQHGLLRARFGPPAPIREWRELTRPRTQLIGEKAAVANRIQKGLEDANVKRGAVASDVLDASGRDRLRALIAGETSAEQLANLARGRLRDQWPPRREALQGRVTEHHRFLLQMHLDPLTHLEALIERLSVPIGKVLAPFREAVGRLGTIPGISQRTAEVSGAEIGPNMAPFPTAEHVTSGAGICPGNDRSVGQRRSGRTPKGNRWLKQALGQAAWAASHTPHTYLAAAYQRLARRRGRQRALLALGRTLLVIVYHVRKRGTTYEELGPDSLERPRPQRRIQHLVKRLESLGHKVTLEPKERVA